MNKSAAGLWIFRSRKRQEFQKTLTVFPSVSSYLMDKKETTVTQCLSPPVRHKPGSLHTENGGHSLLPSPLSPIPHSEAQTRALAHPCRRTREICGDYNPTIWKKPGQDGQRDGRTHARQRQRRRRGDVRISAWIPHRSPGTLLS